MKIHFSFLLSIFLTNLVFSQTATPEKATEADPIELLRTHLSLKAENRPTLAEQRFATMPLTKAQAEQATQLILADRLATLRAERQKEFDAKVIKLGDKTMKYKYVVHGKEPEGGHSLWISMHGGGGAPARVNDQQWSNQINLYQPKEGIMLAPRAPTDTWDLWHLPHIDQFFDRIIENFIAIKGINPNKIYVMGYSAGGDGTYQLAPRMADRWAAAGMMAGHPGDAQFWNLRNLAYIIQCGGKDHAYNRANLCTEWGKKLNQLTKHDPGGYTHKCIVYPEHGHWMKLECRQAVPWMAKNTRNPWPKKLHWYQDNVTSNRFHWISNKKPKHKQLISATVKEDTITLNSPQISPSSYRPALKAMGDMMKIGDFTPLETITLRLSDQLVDMDKTITIINTAGNIYSVNKVSRTITAIHQSIQERPDPTSVAYANFDIFVGR